MRFRLSVINPNSDPAVTEYLRAATARALRAMPGTPGQSVPKMSLRASRRRPKRA